MSTKYAGNSIYLNDPMFNENIPEQKLVIDNIKKWLSIQQSASASIVVLIEHAILRFGYSDINTYAIQTELINHSPFQETFQEVYADHLKFDSSDIEINPKFKKFFRASLLSKKLTKEDEMKFERWFEAQLNLSRSIRLLITEAVEIIGFVNVTSLSIYQGLTLLHTLTKTHKVSGIPTDVFKPILKSSFDAIQSDKFYPNGNDKTNNNSEMTTAVTKEETSSTSEIQKASEPPVITKESEEKPSTETKKPVTPKAKKSEESNTSETLKIDANNFF